MTFTALTLLLLVALPPLFVAGFIALVLSLNGIQVDTYPNPDSR